MMQSAASGASAPLPHQDPDRDSFGSLDLNGDGRLSLAEAAGYGDIMTRFRARRPQQGRQADQGGVRAAGEAAAAEAPAQA